jgi:hypothetical protein
MQERLFKPVERALAAVLKEAGYKKKGQNWWLTKDETILVVNLQRGPWGGDLFYINLGVYLKRLGSLPTPKEYECHIRSRVDPERFSRPMRPTEFEFKDTSEDGAARESVVIGQLLRDNGLPWLDALSTEAEINRLFKPDPPLNDGWATDSLLEWVRNGE